MKTKIVDMMLAFPLISAAGVPAAMAAVPVPIPEPMPVMEDSPDMALSKNPVISILSAHHAHPTPLVGM